VGSALTTEGGGLLGPGGRTGPGPPGRGTLGAPRTPSGGPPRPLMPGPPRPIGILGLIPLTRGPPGPPRIITPPRPLIGGRIILAPGAPRGGTPPPRGGSPPLGGAPPLTPGGPTPLTELVGPMALTGLTPLPPGLAPIFPLPGLPPLPAGDVSLEGEVSLTPIPEVPVTGLPPTGGFPTMRGGGVPLGNPPGWETAVDVMRDEGFTRRTTVVVGGWRRLLRG